MTTYSLSFIEKSSGDVNLIGSNISGLEKTDTDWIPTGDERDCLVMECSLYDGPNYIDWYRYDQSDVMEQYDGLFKLDLYLEKADSTLQGIDYYIMLKLINIRYGYNNECMVYRFIPFSKYILSKDYIINLTDKKEKSINDIFAEINSISKIHMSNEGYDNLIGIEVNVNLQNNIKFDNFSWNGTGIGLLNKLAKNYNLEYCLYSNVLFVSELILHNTRNSKNETENLKYRVNDSLYYKTFFVDGFDFTHFVTGQHLPIICTSLDVVTNSGRIIWSKFIFDYTVIAEGIISKESDSSYSNVLYNTYFKILSKDKYTDDKQYSAISLRVSREEAPDLKYHLTYPYYSYTSIHRGEFIYKENNLFGAPISAATWSPFAGNNQYLVDIDIEKQSKSWGVQYPVKTYDTEYLSFVNGEQDNALKMGNIWYKNIQPKRERETDYRMTFIDGSTIYFDNLNSRYYNVSKKELFFMADDRINYDMIPDLPTEFEGAYIHLYKDSKSSGVCIGADNNNTILEIDESQFVVYHGDDEIRITDSGIIINYNDKMYVNMTDSMIELKASDAGQTTIMKIDPTGVHIT